MDLQAQYFAKASEAYQRQDYKYSLILLKKVPLTGYKIVDLVVNCSYDYWKKTVIATADSKAVSRQSSRPGTASRGKHNQVVKFTGAEQKSISELLSAAEEEPSRDDKLVLDAIKESFTQLLVNVGVVPIKQYDYIRLTHVYLTEGSLHGALQILQLASARGFLEDPLIIIQSYTIMRRISKEVDVESTMAYLVSALVNEALKRKRPSNSRQGQRAERQDRTSGATMPTPGSPQRPSTQALLSLRTTMRRDGYRLNLFPLNIRQSAVASTGTTTYVSESDLPRQFVFLHCAAYVQRMAQQHRRTARVYQKHIADLGTILSEAYFLVKGEINEDIPALLAWFNDPQLWYDMALMLDVHSPYVLLAQDSFWEAFTRAPLEEAHIVGYVNSLLRNKRRADVPALLAQAMEVNPWNLFVRQSLYELDLELVSEPNERQWAKLLEHDEYYCTMVQKRFRGWRLRQQWEELLARLTQRKALYQGRKQQALQRERAIWKSHKRTVLVAWKVYVENWKALKHHSCTLVQSQYRGRLWRVWYRWYKQRIARANATYLIAYQRARDRCRVRAFQRWYGELMKRRRQRSADIIINVLYMNGYSRILRAGMDFLITVLRVRRKYAYRRTLRYWHDRFLDMRQRRARSTIRFFIRRCCGRRAQVEKEMQLAQVFEVMQQKAAVMFRKSDLPMLRKVWAKWYHEFMVRAHAHKLERLSEQLALLFFQKRARAIRRGLRARVEAQLAFVRQTWHRKVNGIFTPWRENAGARIIQRAVRVRQAAKIYHRLLEINAGVEHMQYEHKVHWLQRSLRCWGKYNYLVRRERARAARWIVRLFRIIMHRAMLRRRCAAKVAMGRLAFALHRSHLHLCLRRLKIGTVYANRYIALKKMVRALMDGTLREAWYRWARLVSAQGVAHRLAYLQTTRPVERLYWVGAATSVAMRKVDAPSLDYTDEEAVEGPIGDVDGAVGAVGETFTSFGDIRASTAAKLDALIAQCVPYEARYQAHELYVPANAVVLLDNAARWQLRAFQAWTALYRLRQRYLRGVAHELSAHISCITQHWCLRRVSAAFRVQNLFRQFHAHRLVQTLRQRLRQQTERLEIIHVKHERNTLKYAWGAYKKGRVLLRNEVVHLQSFIRKTLARKNFNKLYDMYSHLRSAGNCVRARYHDRLLREAMATMQLQYCLTLCKAITCPGTDLKRRFAELGGEDVSLRPAKKGKMSSRDAAFARLQVKQPAKVQQSQSTDALTAGRDFSSEECRQHLLRLRETGTFIFDCTSVSTEDSAGRKSRSRLGSLPRAHQPPTEARLHPHLSDGELAFCLQNADVVFCQQARKAALRAVVTHFTGSKLVLRGGELTASSVAYLLYNFLQAAQIKQTGDGPGESGVSGAGEQPLILQLSTVYMGVSARLALIRSIAAQKPPDAHSVGSARVRDGSTEVPGKLRIDASRVTSLVADTDSFGVLGAAVLLASLQYNTRLRSLALKLTDPAEERAATGEGPAPGILCSTLEHAVILLSRNDSIAELRFYGMVLDVALLRGLLRGITSGFSGLRLVEFSISLTASPEPTGAQITTTAIAARSTGGGLVLSATLGPVALAEAIIDAAKARAYAGKEGLAVKVNYC